MEKLNSKGDTRGMNSKLSDASKRGRDKAKLNIVQKEDLTDKIIEWIVAGHSNIKIKDLIKENSPVELTDSNAFSALYYAMSKLEELTKEEVSTVILLHTGHCEQIYEYFHSIDNVTGMNKTMKHKEDLMKLGAKITVNVDHNKTTIIEKEAKYNLDRLSPRKKKQITAIATKDVRKMILK
jgi:hypothetical protein